MDANVDVQTGEGQVSGTDSTAGSSAGGSWLSRIGGAFRKPDGTGVRWTSVAVAAVLAVVVGLLAWNWYSSSRSTTEQAASSTPAASSAPGPVLMTQEQLRATVSASGHSIYWAGPRGLKSYEVTFVGHDVYVRYLPASEPAGSKNAYLTVGTYEKSDAYAGLVKAAALPGAKSGKLTGGALVVVPADKPTSAYFAFEGHNLLMEVYDPTPGEALKLVTSGVVEPIQ
jgi:hypothetical protein